MAKRATGLGDRLDNCYTDSMNADHLPIIQVALPVILMRQFDYLLPDHMPKPAIGARVAVPFGPRTLIGIVSAYPEQSHIALNKLKPIKKIIDTDSIFNDTQWQWLNWASDYYRYPLGEVLMSALPSQLKQGKTLTSLQALHYTYHMSETGTQQLQNPLWVKRAKALAPVLQWVADHPNSDTDAITQLFKKEHLNKLIKENWVLQQATTTSSHPLTIHIKPSPYHLTDEQQQVLNSLQQTNDYQCTVVEGVTGSGKTEIYLQLIAQYLQQGKQVLWLEPEIGLTPQMIKQVQDRFDAPIFLWHSQLTDKQRGETWLAIKQCAGACLVLGTRSAIFSPFQHLDLIIIDESHDSSYQQHSRWQYCAKNMCVKLAHQLNIPIILGSATPSLSTIANIQQQRYQHLRLTKRIQAQPMPEFIWVDTKDQKLTSGLSDAAISIINKTLTANKQVLIFINRRGFSHVLRCHHCGFIHECEHCAMPLVWYKNRRVMQCHHCGFQTRRLPICPDCQQSELSEIGVGTEQIEETLTELFTDYPVLRIDRDHVKTAKQFQTMLDKVATNQPMILVGTQMLAKGHHFQKLSTVVIVNMDGAFFSSDYTAAETMGQLLLQVAGRAGRVGEQGKVVLQTEQAQNPLLKSLVEKGYSDFAELLLQQRQQAHMPPFSHLASCVVEGKYEQELIEQLHALKRFIQPLAHTTGANIIGPMPCLLAKKSGLFRYELMIHTESRSNRHQLLQAIQQWELQQPSKYKKIMIKLDH